MTRALLILFFISNIHTEVYNPEFMAVIGQNYPNGKYDLYVDNGPSYGIEYSGDFFNEDIPLRWNIQYHRINFYNDTYNEDGLKIVDSEDADMLLFGLKFIPKLGIAGNKRIKPYIGASLGYSRFKETTNYIWGDCDSFTGQIVDIIVGNSNFECDYVEDSQNDEVTYHDVSSPIFVVDLGINLKFKNNEKFSFNAGIKYSYVDKLYQPQTSIVNNGTALQAISRTINADFYAYYIGITIYKDN